MPSRKFIFGILFLGYSFALSAQDTLFLIDKSKIGCKVLEVRLRSVNYKMWGQPNSPLYNIEKSLIYYIQYNNGAIDTINPLPAPEPAKSGATPGGTGTEIDSSYKGYDLGYANGYRDFDDRKPAYTAGITTGLVGIYGIVVPISYAVSKLPPNTLNLPAYTRSSDDVYKQGYIKGAKKHRTQYAWRGFWVAEGVRAAILVALIASIF